MKSIQWKQRGIVAIFAVSLLGVPQIAAAYDGCNRNAYYNGAYQRPYYRSHDGGYGYGQPYGDYRNAGNYDSDYARDHFAGEGYRDDNYYGGDYGYYSQRSHGKSAAIVGGTAAAGAIFGALAGGGKGAAIGAVVGGLGGLIFDQATKERHGR